MSGRRFRIVSDSEDEDTDNRLGGSGGAAEQPGDSEPEEAISGEKQNSEGRRARLLQSSDEEADSDDERSKVGRTLLSGKQSHQPEQRIARAATPEDRTDENSDGERSEHGGEEDERMDDGENPNQDGEDREEDAGERGEDEAEEEPARKIVKEKVVKNPQPKLDANLLTGDRGLILLKRMQPHLRLKGGKGNESQDLRSILHHLQLWGHKMFPKMQTKDVFDRCHRLGAKMPVKVYLRKLRTGQLPTNDEAVIDSEDETPMETVDHMDDTPQQDSPMDNGQNRDIFNELLEETRNNQQRSPAKADEDNRDKRDEGADEVARLIEERRANALRRRQELMEQRRLQESQQQEFEEQMSREMEAAS